MPCCALIPMAALLICWPMLAAGKGPRAFGRALAVEAVALLLIAVGGLQETIALLRAPAANGPLLVGIGLLVALPIIMGGVILYARRLEEGDVSPPGKCRRCGYDLRASPDRCPECGTPTRGRLNPEWR